MKTTPYRPAPGSIAWRVLDFLLKNPDEELSRSDIAIKFETAAAMVDGHLAQACMLGAIKRTRGSDDEAVWVLGKNAKHVDLPPWGGEQPVEPPPLYLVPAGEVKIALPTIRKATPILDEAGRRRRAFLEWVGQFEVGDSAEIADSDLHEIRRQVTEHRRTHPLTRFRYVPLRAGVYGIERVADAVKPRARRIGGQQALALEAA